MQEELKPCPFCGSAASLEYNFGKDPWVQCTNLECGATDGIEHETGHDAINFWNRRTPVSGEVAGLTDAQLVGGSRTGWCGALAGVGLAQGIDHAKMVEGDREAFEAWLERDGYPVEDGELARDSDGYVDDTYASMWCAWQARGQQAGVPESEFKVRRRFDGAFVITGSALKPGHGYVMQEFDADGKFISSMIGINPAAAPREAE